MSPWSVTQNLNLLTFLHVPAESKHSKLPAYYTFSNDPSHIVCEYLPTLYDAEHSVKVAQRQMFEIVFLTPSNVLWSVIRFSFSMSLLTWIHPSPSFK